MTRFQLIDSTSDGDVETHEVQDGTSLISFLTNYLDVDDLDSLFIRANRERVAEDYIIRDGDLVTVTSSNVSSASF